MPTQQQLALAMVQQLRIIDPSVSAEVGTPERKILDTVAQALAEAQIDLNQLTGTFDIDAKFGSDLDKFLSIFGFGRQQGSQAIGFVIFSRTTPSNFDIPIPRGTQVVAPNVVTDGTVSSLSFATSDSVTLAAGDLEVIAPIRCIQVGTIGNVAEGTITDFSRSPILGITQITNGVPTSGGTNPETDAEFKVRFKNTVFRNLAGTEDQYLALAVSTPNTTKANIVGPISRYREYIQVPDVDDATADPDSGVVGSGSAGEWTSALSTIPYSKHIYDEIPYFVTNGGNGANAIFYRRDVDFSLNTVPTAKNRGDAYRAFTLSDGPDPLNSDSDFQPNLTFFNVFDGTDPNVQALHPRDVVLFEHSYMSTASRNDWDRQIMNCVDVFVNGSNPLLADAVTVTPDGSANLFTADPSDRLYVGDFRRVGEPERRPVPGNIFMGLFWTPAVDVPANIITSDATYYRDIHYHTIEDVSGIGRSIRARTGIEWNPTVKGQASGDEAEGPYSGPTIVANDDQFLEITGYQYDRNIVDLQTALDGAKQITTDVLAHQARIRYFRLDVTVMYTAGTSIVDTNNSIQEAVANYFASLYFGTAIQLSDILQAIHNVGGVDNVRWSRDILNNLDLDTDVDGYARNRLRESDITGDPLLSALVSRKVYGWGTSGSGAAEVQHLYITGDPDDGTFKLKLGAVTSNAIDFDVVAAALQTELVSGPLGLNVTVTGAGTPDNPFEIAWASPSANGPRELLKVTQNKLEGTVDQPEATVFDSDFFLKDNELPALPSTAFVDPDLTVTRQNDTVPGLIIRARAQNTWNQL